MWFVMFIIPSPPSCRSSVSHIHVNKMPHLCLCTHNSPLYPTTIDQAVISIISGHKRNRQTVISQNHLVWNSQAQLNKTFNNQSAEKPCSLSHAHTCTGTSSTFGLCGSQFVQHLSIRRMLTLQLLA